MTMNAYITLFDIIIANDDKNNLTMSACLRICT